MLHKGAERHLKHWGCQWDKDIEGIVKQVWIDGNCSCDPAQCNGSMLLHSDHLLHAMCLTEYAILFSNTLQLPDCQSDSLFLSTASYTTSCSCSSKVVHMMQPCDL